MRSNTDSEMKSGIKHKHFLFGLVGVIILAIAIVSIPFFYKNTESNVKTELMDYTKSFLKNHPHESIADSTQHSIIETMDKNMANDSIFYFNLRVFCRNMFEKGEQSAAMEYLNNAVSLMQNNRCDDNALGFKAYCHLLLGAATDEVGLSSMSHEYYFKGMKILDKIGNNKLKGDFYNNLGVSLFHAGQREKARAYFDTAMNFAVKTDNSRLMSIIHTNIAEIYSSEGKYEKSIDHLLKSIHTSYTNLPDEDDTKKEEYYSLQSELGSLYLKSNNLPMAYACLSNAYNKMDKGKNKAYIYTTAYLMASYFNAVSEPDSVKKFMEIAWRTADAENNPYHRMLLYEKEMDMESENSNYDSALSLAKKVLLLKDSLHNQENLYSIEHSLSKYHDERVAMEKKSSIYDLHPVGAFTTLVVLLTCALIFIIWLMFRGRRIRDNQNAETKRILQEAAEYKKELSDLRADTEKMKEELRQCNQQLSSFALERLKMNPGIEDVSTDIKRAITKLPPREKEMRGSLSGILSKLSVLQSDTKWDDFQYYFENVHPDFYERLDRAHPNLTAKERRLCALLSLGMSTKDIASVVNLEIRSVESSRNRLRKKLELDNDCNLFDYIKSI